jgi:orotidine-5'-phosphate decarboxylase
MSDGEPRARFEAAIESAREVNHSCLCIGLDPEPSMMPEQLRSAGGLLTFCRKIVEATSDLVCAYKPNVAFFERYGADGWRVLEELVAAIPGRIPVIGDAKRGDIGNTSRAYAESMFDRVGFQACTISPYLGVDAVAPFVDHPKGFAFLLCRTSNPGAAEIQDLVVEGEPLFARVIRLFQPALQSGGAGLVIGASEKHAFAWAARLAPRAHILVPGIGAQGGTVADLAAGLRGDQARYVVVSVSRAIVHASHGQDYAEAARHSAQQLRASLQDTLQGQAVDHGGAASS